MRTHSLLLYLYQASLLHQQTHAQVLQVAEHTEAMCHSLYNFISVTILLFLSNETKK